MSALLLQHFNLHTVRSLVEDATAPTHRVNATQREHLTNYLRGRGPSVTVDAWSVEHAGELSDGFSWSTRTARRSLSSGALRRVRAEGLSALAGARDEIDDRLARHATGYSRSKSVGQWLASLDRAALASVIADVAGWTTTLIEIFADLETDWLIAASDAFYDVSGALVTLRGRRDVIVPTAQGRVVVRVRAGLPGPHAGAGLRADFAVDALAEPDGHPAARLLGLWPEAGIALGVEGDLDNLRLGVRDLIRAVNVRRELGRAA